MARSSCVLFLLALVFVTEVLTTNGTTSTMRPMGGEGSLTPDQCPSKCDFRCSETHHKKPCLFYCNYCCKKCLCVPSGTYGHKEECPCYDNMKTEQGTPKCP